MNKVQKPAYQSPGIKTVNLSPRRGVCQQVVVSSLLGDAIELGELDPTTGEVIDL